ncbi:MAG TPA: methionyl-tRNA formyltransferase [Pseudolabrys sp.]|jgi:methionyl-tRNA formyltransferase|nr:methionyl-tRNA formyltransferase [Pseudolabrys sp.]
MNDGQNYTVATIKSWNLAAFARHRTSLAGQWQLITQREELTFDNLERTSPRYVFFPHWSWRVPSQILSRFECVCFHMSDVPYGRGGSPLQNLILGGHKSTMLSALRMVEEMDAGPVYIKKPLSLEGCAEEIFERAAELVFQIIREIIEREPVPESQVGHLVTFERRTPEQSSLPKTGDILALYDFVRMLDAPTYPRAFIEWGEFRLELDHAELASPDSIVARAVIRLKGP